jgi:hypothetical protein
MANLKKFIGKEILIRLTNDGFVSTVWYACLYSKSTTWQTRVSEIPGKEIGEPAFSQADADDPGFAGFGEN